MRTRAIADDVDSAEPDRALEGPEHHRRARRAVNVAVGASVPVLALADVVHDRLPTGPAVGVVAVGVVAGAALLYRVRWPLPALLVTLAGVVGALLVDQVSPPLIAACLIAVFTVASVRPRREAAVAAGVSAVTLLAVARTDLTGPMTEARSLIVVVWTALAFALGVAVRTQRAYVTALAERARRADETREQEARTRVAEERVRIARELHDVVAHHIAVINVHAGLARRAAGRDAATVDSSLAYVQEAARTVLDELGAVLRVLRSSDAAAPETEPAPGLDRLDELLATFARVGLAVHTSATGRPREMDRACDLAAFRIIQESLTNASKHGAGAAAELGLVHAADALTITVTNLVRVDPGGPPGAGDQPAGHGLIGMRERADACGGSLTAHLDGHGVFRVVAVIPYRPAYPAAPPAPMPAAPDPPCRHRGRAPDEDHS